MIDDKSEDGAWVRDLDKLSDEQLREKGLSDEDIYHIRELRRHLEPHDHRGDSA